MCLSFRSSEYILIQNMFMNTRTEREREREKEREGRTVLHGDDFIRIPF